MRIEEEEEEGGVKQGEEEAGRSRGRDLSSDGKTPGLKNKFFPLDNRKM